MTTCLMLAFLVLTIICIKKAINEHSEYHTGPRDKEERHKCKMWVYLILSIVLAIAFFINIISFLSGISILANAHIIDDKIAIYEERNSKIESEVEVLVQNYEDWEYSTYSEFKEDGGDVVALAVRYPTLKADTLVMQQIELYCQNNEIITALEVEKAEISKVKFEIYFGR